MSRRVGITGVGVVSAAGIGCDALWAAVTEGRSAIAPIESFDASSFQTQIAGEVRDLSVSRIVPRHYRKATKIMARDIELAVCAVDCAVRDAGLVTPGTDPDADGSYPGDRTGVHIGAGLIAADVDELTAALIEAQAEDGTFDMHDWGREGMSHLTPLWLLKYLPNMLACHVTIIHSAQGPSSTITCGEASATLSMNESVRVIQRHAADVCFGGGADYKINPLACYRQIASGRVTPGGLDAPESAVRPFDTDADGTALGEAGAILVMEELELAQQRGARVYAEIVGFGASHTISNEQTPYDPPGDGRGPKQAILSALRQADIEPDAIDLVIPTGLAIPAFDREELATMQAVFGSRVSDVPVWSVTPYVGNTSAAHGAVAAAVACHAIDQQTIPAVINCDQPLDALAAGTAAARPATLDHVLLFQSSYAGQNAAVVLKKV